MNKRPHPATENRAARGTGAPGSNHAIAARSLAALLLCLVLALSLSSCSVRDIPGVSGIESFFKSLNQQFAGFFEDENLLYGRGSDNQGSTNGGGYTYGPDGGNPADDNGGAGGKAGTGSDSSKNNSNSGTAYGGTEGWDAGWENGLAPQGSAKVLEGNVVLVSVYLIDGSNDYTKEELSYTRKALDMASEWLEGKAKEHGVSLKIIRNDTDLTFRYRADGMLRESQKEISFTYTDTIGDYLAHFDLSVIMAEYDADSVGFVIFLPGEGTSFAYPYTATGNAKWDAIGYYEFSNLFLYDESAPDEYENPATYAHEIMHLFGACDLYEENKTDNISQELSDYVADTYPDEIMYYTYEDDDTSNFEEITKDMSPVTLYFIGWGDGGEEIRKFPEITRKYPCAFE